MRLTRDNFVFQAQSRLTHVETVVSEVEKDLFIVDFLINEAEKLEGALQISWSLPAIDMHYRWNSKINLIKACTADWFKNLYVSNALTGAPVECMMNFDNRNRLTWSFSDTINESKLTSTIEEETGNVQCVLEIFRRSRNMGKRYNAQIRIDMRDMPYYESLDDVQKWWTTYSYNVPATVPQAAKVPMYSTWYSFHQNLESNHLVEQCKIAKEYGCEAIIIDDGWQTDDNNRGYAYCGDWEVATSKIPNMKKMVEEIHEIGMGVLLWYPVPFIGVKSKNFERFKDMIVTYVTDEWAILDPRYKEVREYIINTYEEALREWDLDGFKLDFIDEFVVNGDGQVEKDERRDVESLLEASDILLKECLERLRKIKPEIMVEFRQTYIGPTMRTYGNIFRAVDCPVDAFENRVRTTDIRLLNGNSATHADMVMWHKEDSAVSAAMQLTGIFFSVPQISVLIDELCTSHKKMLKFYLETWNKYREIITEGKFMPLNPFSHYNILSTEKDGKCIIAYHDSLLIEIEKDYSELVIVNGTLKNKCILESEKARSFKSVTVYDCEGQVIKSGEDVVIKGIMDIEVPAAGIVVFK